MFRLPEKVKQSIDEYRHSLSDVRRERLTPSRFRGIRVPWGIYSHRGGKVFMTRVRIPVGAITSSQLHALAEVASKYGKASLHITTRQDIQIHNVKLTDTAKVIEYLKDYDLSPRGGGGNTIRNVVACPRSGICPDEVFDVRGYAVGLTEYLLQQESSFNLPRKFKISFSGCAHDCAGCLVNDAGFQAKYQDKKKGFAVFVGGGLGAHSRIGQSLTEFLPEEDLGYCVSAMNNVYCHTGDRRNKHHNRLRFLIEDMGMAKFRELYVQEFTRLKRDTDITLRQIQFRSMSDTEGKIPIVADEQFQDFLQYNVKPQRQRGLSSIDLRIPRGDISSEKLSAIAALVEDFENISFGTTQNQNLIITGVRNKDTYRLFVKLKEILDDFLYPETAMDVVACKGALTCNLGLCNSPGLAEIIETSLQKEMVGKKIFGKLQLKLNGCPNSCGQHPVGMVSLCGMARQIDNHRAPYYKLFLGGRKGIEKTRLAEAVGIIPAKNVVNFLREFFDRVEQSIGEHDDLYRFLAEQGKSIATSILARHSCIPAYEEDRDYYIDWGKNEEFSLDGLGPGECGAGVLDMIEADLKDAWSAIDKAAADHCSPR